MKQNKKWERRTSENVSSFTETERTNERRWAPGYVKNQWTIWNYEDSINFLVVSVSHYNASSSCRTISERALHVLNYQVSFHFCRMIYPFESGNVANSILNVFNIHFCSKRILCVSSFFLFCIVFCWLLYPNKFFSVCAVFFLRFFALLVDVFVSTNPLLYPVVT